MKKSKVIVVVMLACLCITCNHMVCWAADDKEISARQYKENLLVSYKEYWYTDGAGIENYVRYDKQYREYIFINGYTSSKRVTPIPITNELPAGTTRHNSVKVTYTFY